MTVSLAVHGHFYQPPRENPWTEVIPRETGAAPYHDWNERIAAECYRPNAFARVVDPEGLVVDIVNNYGLLSFDVGPTLTGWLAQHEPAAWARILDADAAGRGGLAQAYFHVILPLSDPRDVVTMVRWGLAEFAFRFGRPAVGLWLPETAVNESVMAVLAEEGVGFTVLEPTQADRPIEPGRRYRWMHPADDGRGVDVVFYDGELSRAVAFESSEMSSQALVERIAGSGGATDGEGLVVVATDGETFGHHHPFSDRALAYALTVEAPLRDINVTNLGQWLARDASDASEPEPVGVVESSWSCPHGVGRWREDCGCSTGGAPGSNQRWRAPVREALGLVKSAVREVFERRGAEVLRHPWVARDDYVKVLLDPATRAGFCDVHVTGDPVVALALLEAERNALAMFTSCGWFFHDVAGIETIQVLRYGARAMDWLRELGEPVPVDAVLDVLATAKSNDPAEGTGADIWREHVDTARVDAVAVARHAALAHRWTGVRPTEVGVWGVTDGAVVHGRTGAVVDAGERELLGIGAADALVDVADELIDLAGGSVALFERALTEGGGGAAEALAVLDLAEAAGVDLSIERVQEAVFAHRRAHPEDPAVAALAARVGLAP